MVQDTQTQTNIQAQVVQNAADAATMLPLLGNIVSWSMQGVEINHSDLVQRLRVAGLEKYTPNSSTAKRAMKRAIYEWLRDTNTSFNALAAQSDDDTMSERVVSMVLYKQHVVFFLESKELDLNEYGLTHYTNLRIRLPKPKARNSHGQDLSTLDFVCTTTATGNFDLVQSADDIKNELFPYWQKYSRLCTGQDVTTMCRAIVYDACGGVSLRAKSGFYFVPASGQATLDTLITLVEGMPNDGKHTPYIISMPQVDVAGAKVQLAKAAHEGFMAQLQDTQREFGRLVNAKPGTVRPETAAKFIAEFDELQSRADIYADVLAMRSTQIATLLTTMRQQAQALITSDAIGDGDTETPTRSVEAVADILAVHMQAQAQQPQPAVADEDWIIIEPDLAVAS